MIRLASLLYIEKYLTNMRSRFIKGTSFSGKTAVEEEEKE